MANYNDLKTGIDAVIKTNGRQKISGAALNTALNNMITELGAGYQYMGVATPATNPGTPDANVFYLASEAGTYTNFGGIVINEGEVCALVWNGTWTKQVTGAATADQLNQLGQYINNPEWVKVVTDGEGKILYGVKSDGKFYTGDGLTFLEGVDSNALQAIQLIDNPEFVQVTIDKENRIIEGINRKGEKYIGTLDYSTLEKLKNLILTMIGEKVPLQIRQLAPLEPSYLVIGADNEGAKQNYCIAIGVNVLTHNTGIKNHVIGLDSMANCTGSDNTAMGHHSGYRNEAGECNTAIGSESQDDNTDGNRNTSMGFCSLQRNNIGSYNVAIGNFALRGGIEGTHFDPDNLKSFNRNISVGAFSLHAAQSGTNENIAIGYYALASEKVYKNNIAIGNNVECDKDNQTIIGNTTTIETILMGDLIVKGIDGVKRKIVFNQDGTCSWIEVE